MKDSIDRDLISIVFLAINEKDFLMLFFNEVRSVIKKIKERIEYVFYKMMVK